MSETIHRDTKRRGWVWLVVIGIATAIVGVIVGFQTAGRLCGGVFRPSSPAAEYYDLMGGSGGMASLRTLLVSARAPGTGAFSSPTTGTTWRSMS